MAEWRVPGFTELRELGAGGQGLALLVREDASGRTAVLKYLFGAADPASRDAFRRESTLLKGVASPYVARWYGHYEDPAGSAILMEAVPGRSLKDVLAEQGPLAPEAALTVLKGSLLGLAAAHERGVVHRDYKPANVIVRDDGVSKLIDFGIAGYRGEASRSGTPAYMAPEQWSGAAASPATDVYAATCVFVECVTGERPYAGELDEVQRRHLLDAVPIEPVPDPLRPLVAAGLAKAEADRPPSATAFVAELDAVATTAYGTDWETRGVAGLAVAAAAVAALLPAAALASGSTVTALAGGTAAGSAAGGAAASGTAAGGSAAGGSAAGGTAAGGTAAGGTGGGVGVSGTAAGSSGGLASTVGGKVALVVGGLTAAGAVGTAGVLVVNHHGAPPVVAARPAVGLVAAVAPYQAPPGAWLTASAVTVSGGSDPAVRAKINAALLAPLRSEVAEEQGEVRQGSQQCAKGTVQAAPSIALRRPRLLSVGYWLKVGSCSHDGASGMTTVTVDLATGATLTAKDFFVPGALTLQGVRALEDRMTMRGTSPQCTAAELGDAASFLATLTSSGLGYQQNEQHVLFTAGGIQVWHGIDHLCGPVEWSAPYSAIRRFLRPDFAAHL